METNGECNIRKSDPNLSFVRANLHSTSARHITEKQDPKKQEYGTETLISSRNCYQSFDKSVYQKTKHKRIDVESSDCDDLEFVVAYSKSSPAFQAMKSILLHLKLQKHAVRGDDNCLYHAIAIGLIPSSSDGDEAVCRHFRHLAFLTMLSYSIRRLLITSGLDGQAAKSAARQCMGWRFRNPTDGHWA